ncbi:mitochondrial protein Pet127-domain-containing protein [Phaeosphaeria sp. MPI-PUGE-AT-0046c]|nr:mitochondrial protein Pet127-domain-containing protein [Phaeosphaeria sp. MPI-PUGE-AT-0046c]
MLRQHILRASPWTSRPLCLFCAANSKPSHSQTRSWSATPSLSTRARKTSAAAKNDDKDGELIRYHMRKEEPESIQTKNKNEEKSVKENAGKKNKATKDNDDKNEASEDTEMKSQRRRRKDNAKVKDEARKLAEQNDRPLSLKEALLGARDSQDSTKARKKREEQLHIQELYARDLDFEPVSIDTPPVPMLSYGLDRVLFNPGVYRLQDPRSRIYNFDPYLEKIMPVKDFNFDALSEYKTSSKDETLLALTERLGIKFTGSTSSMSGILQHFHFLLSDFRSLNHTMLSRGFPSPSAKFSKITFGPDAIFLRYKKDGVYAMDADKTYDSPNIMSWLGHSLEKLLTTNRDEFELFRRSSTEKPPVENDSSRCYHYSKQGNLLMRSQLDAQDPRLPGTGIFDLKTRAVVSIRMDHKQYETGSGYQLRFDQGEWESYEREFYDMTRATMLKYSLQVRMGRMDGVFLAYHNIERIFGFQYLSRADLDRVLHGQENTELGDQEFKLSLALLDEILVKATAQFPETSIRLHFESRDAKTSFMYIFAEPVTEAQADEIQNRGAAAQEHFTRTVVGISKDDPKVQEAWHNIQDNVDEQMENDSNAKDAKAVDEVADEETAEKIRESESGENEEVSELEQEEAEGMQESANEEKSSEADSEESPASILEKNFPTKRGSTEEPSSRGPLMGWTLSTRSQVNGGYVHRPVNIGADDEWKLEYHIQEIPEASRWTLYDALVERRRSNIGLDDEDVDIHLQIYRKLIKRYSMRGREYRAQQDKLNEELGVQIYKPLGPGSDAAKKAADEEETKVH